MPGVNTLKKTILSSEVNLCDVVHSAIADNKYLLRQSNMSIQIDDIETKVYTDEKWVRFILNQIIGNAIKYHAEQPILHFRATKTNDKIVLSISDNGIGIPKSDLPRIFEKGFTGQNGRTGEKILLELAYIFASVYVINWE